MYLLNLKLFKDKSDWWEQIYKAETKDQLGKVYNIFCYHDRLNILSS